MDLVNQPMQCSWLSLKPLWLFKLSASFIVAPAIEGVTRPITVPTRGIAVSTQMQPGWKLDPQAAGGKYVVRPPREMGISVGSSVLEPGGWLCSVLSSPLRTSFSFVPVLRHSWIQALLAEPGNEGPIPQVAAAKAGSPDVLQAPSGKILVTWNRVGRGAGRDTLSSLVSWEYHSHLLDAW